MWYDFVLKCDLINEIFCLQEKIFSVFTGCLIVYFNQLSYLLNIESEFNFTALLSETLYISYYTLTSLRFRPKSGL